jgi:hypothetical protein
MQLINTIGFFGDSFCAEEYNLHSAWYKYETYIKQISKHYDAKIVNLGQGGSSIWDTLLIQLKPFADQKEFPDVCFFVWTNSGRLFHREVRRINNSDALTPKLHTYNIFKHKIWEAAKQYYTHLYDHEQAELAHNAMLHYVDNVILPTFPKTTKIIHTWTSANPTDWSMENLHPNKIKYCHKWKHGVEIRPPLICLSLSDKDVSNLQTDKRANHLEGTDKNSMLTKWIEYAIENYKDGLCLDYTTDVAKLWP